MISYRRVLIGVCHIYCFICFTQSLNVGFFVARLSLGLTVFSQHLIRTNFTIIVR